MTFDQNFKEKGDAHVVEVAEPYTITMTFGWEQKFQYSLK